jgi:hypothetical protein
VAMKARGTSSYSLFATPSSRHAPPGGSKSLTASTSWRWKMRRLRWRRLKCCAKHHMGTHRPWRPHFRHAHAGQPAAIHRAECIVDARPVWALRHAPARAWAIQTAWLDGLHPPHASRSISKCPHLVPACQHHTCHAMRLRVATAACMQHTPLPPWALRGQGTGWPPSRRAPGRMTSWIAG